MEELTREDEIALLEMELRALLTKLFAQDLNTDERVERVVREMKWRIHLNMTTH